MAPQGDERGKESIRLAEDGSGGGGEIEAFDRAAYERRLLDDYEKQDAAKELGGLAEAARPMLNWLLCLALTDSDDDVCTAAQNAIEAIDTAVAKQMKQLLDEDASERQKAVEEWAAAEPRSALATLAILAYVREEDEEVKRAVQTIAQKGPALFIQAAIDVSAVLLHKSKLEDTSNWTQRRSTIWAVENAAPHPILAGTILTVAQKDADYDVRESAVKALGQWGQTEGATLTDIIAIAITDDMENVRDAADQVVKELQKDSTQPLNVSEMAKNLLDQQKIDEPDSALEPVCASRITGPHEKIIPCLITG